MYDCTYVVLIWGLQCASEFVPSKHAPKPNKLHTRNKHVFLKPGSEERHFCFQGVVEPCSIMGKDLHAQCQMDPGLAVLQKKDPHWLPITHGASKMQRESDTYRGPCCLGKDIIPVLHCRKPISPQQEHSSKVQTYHQLGRKRDGKLEKRGSN